MKPKLDQLQQDLARKARTIREYRALIGLIQAKGPLVREYDIQIEYPQQSIRYRDLVECSDYHNIHQFGISVRGWPLRLHSVPDRSTHYLQAHFVEPSGFRRYVRLLDDAGSFDQEFVEALPVHFRTRRETLPGDTAQEST